MGLYEELSYTGKSKNDWHYVTISEMKTSVGKYEWKNRAEVAWTLIASTTDKLLVDNDCPYYGQGHTEAKLEINQYGEITGIHGPGGLYSKVSIHTYQQD